MYKYLIEKLENTSGAYIENLIFMTNEYCRETMSDVFEDFTELEPEKICEVLNWRKKEEVFAQIQESLAEKELCSLMYRNNLTGFLAECHFPVVSNFKFEKDKMEPYTWTIEPGFLRHEWIYADTMGELFEKIQQVSELLFNEAVEKEINKAFKQ